MAGNKVKKRGSVKRALFTSAISVLLVFCAWLGARYLLMANGTADRMRREVERRVADAVNEPLAMRKLWIDIWGRVVISDVRLGENKEPIFKAKRLIASISLYRLATNRYHAGNIVRKIRIIEPDILIIRLPDGSYNFTKIIKSSTGAGAAGLPQFPITMKHGRARYLDRNTQAPYPIRHVRIDDFSGALSLKKERVMLISLKSKKTDVAESLRLKMKYDLRAGWRLNSDFRQLPLSTLNAFFPKSGIKFGGDAGRLKFYAEAAFTKIGHPPIFSWGGEGTIRGGVFDYPKARLKFSDITGKARFSEKTVLFDNIRASFAGGTVGGGGILAGYSDPLFSARLNYDSVALRDVARIFTEKTASLSGGRVSGSAYFTGGFKSPSALVRFTGAGIAYRAVKADTAAGELFYTGGRLECAVRAKGEKTRLAAKGALRRDERGSVASYTLVTEFSGLDLPSVLAAGGIKLKEPIHGSIAGDVVFQKAAPDKKPAAFGSIQGEDIAVRGLEGASATIGFRYTHGNLLVENFVAESGEELLIADGTINSDGKLDISISAAVGKVTTALAFADRQDLSGHGIIKVTGALRGSMKNPSFSGELAAENVTVSTMSADRITGSIGYTDNVFSFLDISIMAGKDKHRLNGTLDFKKRIMDVDVEVSGASIAGLAGLAKDAFRITQEPPADLSGIVDAHATVKGSFDAPTAKIEAEGSNIKLYGETVSNAYLRMDYNKKIHIYSGRIKAFGGTVGIAGTVSPEAIDLTCKADDLKAEMVAHAKKYRFAGAFNATGLIGGDFKSPTAKVSFSSHKFSFRGTDFSLSGGQMEYHDEKFDFTDMKVSRSTESYDVEADYDLASSGFDVSVTFKNADLKTLTGFLPYKFPAGTSGPLDGQGRIFTRADQLVGGAHITGHDLKVGTYPIDEMSFEGRFDGSQLNVISFDAKNKLSLMQASGILDLSQKASSKLNISAYGIELARLYEMGLISLPVQGLADVIVDLVGEEGSQKMDGSVTAYNPSVNRIGFERAQGLFEYDGNMFTLVNLQMLRGTDRLTVYADLPVRKEFEDRLKVNIQSDGIDLSMLNPLLADYGMKVGGNVGFKNVQIAGSMNNPVFSGTVSLRDATIEHRDMKPALTKINGDMQFSKTSLVINSLTGNWEDKPVKLRGAVEFDKLALESVDLDVQDAKNLYVEYKNIYHGRIDLNDIGLRLTTKSFEITGRNRRRLPTVRLHDGAFTIPTVTSQKSKAPSSFVFGFGTRSFNIKVGDKFTVQNGWKGMRLEPSGQLQLSGNLSNLQIKGWLTSTRGYINFYTTTFKIIDETIIGFYTLEGIGVVPIFYTAARTRVQNTDITMYVSGPMLDINLYPSYRELCGGNESEESSTIRVGGGLGAPTIALGPGGEMVVPVCPSVKF